MEKQYDTKEEYLKNKKFWTDDKGNKISTKNLKEEDVTGLTNTAYKPKEKKHYKIIFNFGMSDIREYEFYGTYKSAELEAEALAKVFEKDISYNVTIK
jgi:hypothetical protein